MWYSPATTKALKEKRKFHKRWKCYRNELDYLTFSILPSRCIFLIERDYNNYLKRCEDSTRDIPKSFWESVSCKKRESTFFPSTVHYNDNVASNTASTAE